MSVKYVSLPLFIVVVSTFFNAYYLNYISNHYLDSNRLCEEPCTKYLAMMFSVFTIFLAFYSFFNRDPLYLFLVTASSVIAAVVTKEYIIRMSNLPGVISSDLAELSITSEYQLALAFIAMGAFAL